MHKTLIIRLRALGEPTDVPELKAYHKTNRDVLAVKVPLLSDIAKEIREQVTLEERLEICQGLWESNIHEARILAAKMLEQARIRPEDDGAWELIKSWVPDFDGWAIADHVSKAGEKRLVADPSRIDDLEAWTTSDHMWTKRAALVMTLPWTKIKFPKDEDIAIRERVLGWAAGYVEDRDWFIQKAIGWWLRDLSKRDPERVRAFIDEHGQDMKAFARKEALRLIKKDQPA